ncbi:J domain-containing protein [Granulosicoccaceae sp. 1_MG-2023]|nr:J domain-containing protein [Granulosicoccaceae sp. 1_MG-2023]
MSDPDFYALLHVAPDAPEAVIKASYRAVMQKLRAHPDLGGDPARAAMLNEALQVLLDPGRRRRYDAARAAGAQVSAGAAGQAADEPAPSAGASRRDTEVVPVVSVSGVRQCCFCGHGNRAAAPAAAYAGEHARCVRCRAPLTPVAGVVAATREGELRRIARVAHQARAEVRSRHAQTQWQAAQIRDFSLRGMSLLVSRPEPEGACVQLRSAGIEAVAEVVNSRLLQDGRHCLGLACVTLLVDLSPGTFVSSLC